MKKSGEKGVDNGPGLSLAEFSGFIRRYRKIAK